MKDIGQAESRRCVWHPNAALCVSKIAGSEAPISHKVGLLTGKLLGRLSRP